MNKKRPISEKFDSLYTVLISNIMTMIIKEVHNSLKIFYF